MVLFTMPFCSVKGSGRMAKVVGKPTIREHTRQVASLAERSIWRWMIRIGLFPALIAREVQILVGQMLPQPFFVRDQQGGRVRTLVIVQDQLVDARGMLYQASSIPSGLYFSPSLPISSS